MMQRIRRNGHWIVALLGIVSLAYAAGMMHERLPLPAALGVTQARETEPAQAPREAEALSSGFRHAAKAALPAMVSIEVRGKAPAAAQANGRDVDPEDMFNGSPFGELFKQDPRLKDMFKFRQSPQQMPRTHGMGSGFIIDPSGIILTANHVVGDAERVTVKLHDGREFVATEVKTDPRTDVAIVRIQADGALPAIRLGDSDIVEIGDWVLAIGSPFGLDATVTAGIISAKGRGPNITEREEFLQTDAAINPGNSGGPLINLAGEVVGINTAISTRSGGYDGVGFTVPINLAKWVADQLIEKGIVTRAYIGVAIQPVNSELSKQFNVPVGKGAIVTQVFPNTPAAAAKLEPGDLVLKFNGKEIRGSRDLQGVVERLKADVNYPMLIVRDGKEMTVNVTTKEMPHDYSVANNTLVPGKSAPETAKADSFDDLGIEIEAAKPEALQKLGYQPSTAGVLVSSVKDDSPAAQAGLREGMVIEKVGSTKVSSPADFKDAVKGTSVEKGVLLLVRTPRGGQFVVVRKAA
jgi:serine protease Do